MRSSPAQNRMKLLDYFPPRRLVVNDQAVSSTRPTAPVFASNESTGISGLSACSLEQVARS